MWLSRVKHQSALCLAGATNVTAAQLLAGLTVTIPGTTNAVTFRVDGIAPGDTGYTNYLNGTTYAP